MMLPHRPTDSEMRSELADLQIKREIRKEIKSIREEERATDAAQDKALAQKRRKLATLESRQASLRRFSLRHSSGSSCKWLDYGPGTASRSLARPWSVVAVRDVRCATGARAP